MRSTAPLRRFMLRTLIVMVGVVCGSRVHGWGPDPATERDMQAARDWVARHLAPPAPEAAGDLPFSFTYNGAPSETLLAAWPRQYTRIELDAQRTEHTLTWSDPATGLRVQCRGIEYRDFPVLEWTLAFHNTSDVDTPIIKDVLPLNATWTRAGESEFVLHHAVGSPANASDYAPRETQLDPAASLRIGAAGGRSTNSDLSYFNLQWGAQGVILAVGWPGQWAAEFTRDNEQTVSITAGQEQTHFKLLPGESVRTPLIALLFWEGDRAGAQNLWRRWMMAHSMPRPGGQLPPPQFLASSSRAYEEMIGANEANQIMHIDRYLEEDLRLDYWWMDAGWYVQQHGWPQVGTWEVDPVRFPRGLRPISDHAHARGVKILVWFEPERVAPGTWLYDQRPQWLLRATRDDAHPLAGVHGWSSSELSGSDPCVTHNSTDQPRHMANIRWEPGQLAFHPGSRGEYAVVRWTAPESGSYTVRAQFSAIDQQTTTAVYVLHNESPLMHEFLQLEGRGRDATYRGPIKLEQGDTLDCAVGWGNDSHICDSTGLEFTVTSSHGVTYDAAAEFDANAPSAGPWSYGYLPPGPRPDPGAFRLMDRKTQLGQQDQRLLNLGDPAARKWLTEHIDQLLVEQGIDLYRQDFNIDPLPYWRANDEPDRQGITEIRYVTGLLEFWDELIRRHPRMLIDTCASGGRRNDLETLRRAVPLWRSDYAFEPVGHQCMTYGISLWIPYHGTGTVACADATYYGGGQTPVEPYAFWSNVAPSLVSGVDIRVRELDYDAIRRLVGQWRQINRFYTGDYYPLTPYSRELDAWIAWQFHDPDTQSGMVQVFRRPAAESPNLSLTLCGLDPDAVYEFTQLDTAATIRLSGTELMQSGFPVSLAERPAAAVLIYQATSTDRQQ